MGLRNAKSLTFRPAGLSDSYDGTNAFPGAMAVLSNLSAAYHTPNAFVPRPAGTPLFSLPLLRDRFGVIIEDRAGGLLSGSGYASNITALLVVGNFVFGMCNSTTYPGYDEPFCFNTATGSAVPISNIQQALLPTSPSASGDWVPPTMVAITPAIVLVTHPGFSGGSGPYLGWIDLSSFTSSSMVATTTNGSDTLTGVVTTVGASAPILQGVKPGQLLTVAGVPAGTYVVSATNGTFTLNTTGNTHTSTLVDGLASTAGVIPGTLVSGPGILAGSYVTVVNSGTSVTLNQATIATATGIAVAFSGNGSIKMSAPATATSAAPTSVTVTGGSQVAPLWGAGNLNTNPLTIVPTCTCGFNGRAYIAAGPYLIFSDILNPQQVTLASQALTIGDLTPITALAGVPLTSQLTGGVQQSLTVFKGAGDLTQITGDAAAGTLAQNTVGGSVGTLAPLSIAQTPVGTAFIAVDGLRILGLSGTLSEPIGAGGTGVNLPFLNALYPSRMCAAYSENVYRVTVRDGGTSGTPTVEYWYDMESRLWTGPHSCAAVQAEEYPYGAAFIIAPLQAPGQLWLSDVLPKASSTYIENGQQLSWVYQTSLLPDSGEGSFNRVTQTNVSCALHASDNILASVVDDNGATLSAVNVAGSSGYSSKWGASKWGSSKWGSAALKMREVPVKWDKPLIFRQAQVSLSGTAEPGQVVGNLYAKFQPVRTNTPLN